MVENDFTVYIFYQDPKCLENIETCIIDVVYFHTIIIMNEKVFTSHSMHCYFLSGQQPPKA